MLDQSPGLWYHTIRERETPSKLKGERKMSYGYYEAHEAEWEAMMAFLAEEEALREMDADYLASGGHLWD